MPRTSDARKRLMDAAHDLIWSYGFGAVTVDTICERAKVKKGSFYYFFNSKSDLAEKAVQAWWDERSRLIEETFRPEVPPLERIATYLDFVAESQIAGHQESGRVLGCPLFTLGCEICNLEDQLGWLVRLILRSVALHFENALVEAWEDGDLDGPYPALKARLLWAFYEGALTHARIENDPESLRTLKADALDLIGDRRMFRQPALLQTKA